MKNVKRWQKYRIPFNCGDHTNIVKEILYLAHNKLEELLLTLFI